MYLSNHPPQQLHGIGSSLKRIGRKIAKPFESVAQKVIPDQIRKPIGTLLNPIKQIELARGIFKDPKVALAMAINPALAVPAVQVAHAVISSKPVREVAEEGSTEIPIASSTQALLKPGCVRVRVPGPGKALITRCTGALSPGPGMVTHMGPGSGVVPPIAPVAPKQSASQVLAEVQRRKRQKAAADKANAESAPAPAMAQAAKVALPLAAAWLLLKGG